MQKFVVSPSIGGASITWAAVKYLVKLVDDNDMPLDAGCSLDIGELAESRGEVGYPEEGTFSPLLSAWWTCYKDSHKDAEFDKLADDDSVYMGCFYSKSLRAKLLPFIETLAGDYDTLDSLNDGCELRVVEVPDGYQCGVVEDPESGCEVVEEFPQIWVAMKDDEYRFLRAVREVCETASINRTWEKETPSIVYDWTDRKGYHTKVAINGEYGMAKCVKGDSVSYLFLKKNTYYTATADHGKECYEIVGDKENKFRLPVIFHGEERVKAYFALAKLLETGVMENEKTA